MLHKASSRHLSTFTVSKDLKTLLPPPSALPEMGVDADWDDKLPEGFAEFLSIYGSGCIDGFLWICSPSSENQNLNLNVQTELFRHGLGSLAAEFESFRPPHFPDVSVLVCLGITDNGNYVCGTRCNGESIIYVFDSRSPEYFTFRGNFMEFIAGLLTREIECSVFPKSFPSGSATFSREKGGV